MRQQITCLLYLPDTVLSQSSKIKDSLWLNAVVVVCMLIKHFTPRLRKSNGKARRAFWGYHTQNGSLSYYLHTPSRFYLLYVHLKYRYMVNDQRYCLFCARKGHIGSNQLPPWIDNFCKPCDSLPSSQSWSCYYPASVRGAVRCQIARALQMVFSAQTCVNCKTVTTDVRTQQRPLSRLTTTMMITPVKKKLVTSTTGIKQKRYPSWPLARLLKLAKKEICVMAYPQIVICLMPSKLVPFLLHGSSPRLSRSTLPPLTLRFPRQCSLRDVVRTFPQCML